MGTANAIDVQEPFTFTAEQEAVLDVMAAGLPAKVARERAGVSEKQLRKWRATLPAFEQAFGRARADGFEEIAHGLLEIRDPAKFPDVQRAKAYSDAVRWAASKFNRALFGDKLDVDVAVTVNIGAALADARARTLRLQRDNEDALDAECTVLSGTCEQRATDTKSEAQTQPVDSSTIPDIFS